MLEVLDTAGQEEYTALRDQWIRDGEGFILVYSITSRASFTRIQKFYSQIQRVKESNPTMSPILPGSSAPMGQAPTPTGPAPVMLVGNKIDRVTERAVSTQEGSALAKQLGCTFIEASAKNCVNVEKAFYDIIRHLRQQRHQTTKQERRVTDASHVGHGSSKYRGPKDDMTRSRKGKAKTMGKQCVIL